MKPHIRVLLVIAVVLFVMGNCVWASVPGRPSPLALGICVPDCEENEFEGPFVETVRLNNGCDVQVTYYKRTACGTYYDLQIQSIIPLNPNCNGIAIADMLHDVENAMWTNNPMGFPMPTAGNCITTYRVSRATCWRLTGGTPTKPYGEYVPCTQVGNNVCCLVYFKICNNGAHNVPTITGSNSTGNSCNVYSGFSCTFVCP